MPPPASAFDPARLVLTVRHPDSPLWIGNLRNAEFRCLVPATRIMAWSRADRVTGKHRQHWLRCTDQPIFAMAGVWKDSEIPGYALLTTEPNAAWRALGAERMPVILPGEPAAWGAWLRGDWARAERLLLPYPGSAIAESG